MGEGCACIRGLAEDFNPEGRHCTGEIGVAPKLETQLVTIRPSKVDAD